MLPGCSMHQTLDPRWGWAGEAQSFTVIGSWRPPNMGYVACISRTPRCWAHGGCSVRTSRMGFLKVTLLWLNHVGTGSPLRFK